MQALDRLPRVSIVRAPTPLEDAPRLAAALGVRRLLVKREDLTDLALGGNKVRKLEFLFGEALARHADTIVTTASAHSNFLRVVSAGARRFGLRPVLLVRGRPDLPSEGNLLLMRLFAERIVYLDTEDPYANTTIAKMRDLERELTAAGRRPYLIHLAAFSAGLATAAYIPAAAELAEQIGEHGGCDRIVLAVGSGGTYAGLLLGLHVAGVAAPVLGASVNTGAAEMRRRIRDQIRAAEDLLGLTPSVREDEIEITDAHVGPGYGIPTAESLGAVALAARTEGLLLDPIYTGKAWAALAHAVRTGAVGRSATVVFMHTGGAPNTFVHGAEVAEALTATS